jgi:hypothetical protein
VQNGTNEDALPALIGNVITDQKHYIDNLFAIFGFPNQRIVLIQPYHRGFILPHSVRKWLGICAGISRSPTVRKIMSVKLSRGAILDCYVPPYFHHFIPTYLM